jgi:zinc and cadmium transporter
MTFLLMTLAILLGSALSLFGGIVLFRDGKHRERAIMLALPFGAGALLAAAFFDLLPEAMAIGNTRSILGWTLAGFTLFFVLERTASWFHHHHEHEHAARNEHQNRLIMTGDLVHNLIDGVAIGAAFVLNPVSGFVTVLAVSAHEIPKEIGTFGMLLSRGWHNRKVIVANALTALGTLVAASLVYLSRDTLHLPEAELLALTSGFFIYIAASDIIPSIHEQPRKVATLQAAVLVGGIVFVGILLRLLGV